MDERSRIGDSVRAVLVGRMVRARSGLAVVAAVVAYAVLPAVVATAATVSVRASSLPDRGGQDEIAYVAQPGEHNRVTMQFGADGPGSATWIVRDPVATLNAGEFCAAMDAHTIRCSPRPGAAVGPFLVANVALGDLDDELSFSGTSSGPAGFPVEPPVFAEGGEGNDRLGGAPGGGQLLGGAGNDELIGGASFWLDDLEGGPGDDRLFGGEGFDELDGGGGRDELHGDAGDDMLADGDLDGAPGDDARPGPDVIDGGEGEDTVRYRQRQAAVVVDLMDSGTDGEPGEGDVLSHIESIVGGRANDRLAGDERPNHIDGGPGHNRLRGGGGDDAFENARGSIFCGAGPRDVVYGGYNSRDFPQPDCERISRDFDDPGVPPYPRVGRRRLTYPFSCFRDEVAETPGPPVCSVTLQVREDNARRRLLARGSLRRGRWEGRKLRARLTLRGRRVASRRSGARAVVRFEESGQSPLRWTIRLRRPR
jgi:hypothetical protein